MDRALLQAFVLRMENDIAKRDSDKRVNEMRKTADGRRVLRQLGMMPAPPRSVALGKLGTDLSFFSFRHFALRRRMQRQDFLHIKATNLTQVSARFMYSQQKDVKRSADNGERHSGGRRRVRDTQGSAAQEQQAQRQYALEFGYLGPLHLPLLASSIPLLLLLQVPAPLSMLPLASFV